MSMTSPTLQVRKVKFRPVGNINVKVIQLVEVEAQTPDQIYPSPLCGSAFTAFIVFLLVLVFVLFFFSH